MTTKSGASKITLYVVRGDPASEEAIKICEELHITTGNEIEIVPCNELVREQFEIPHAMCGTNVSGSRTVHIGLRDIRILVAHMKNTFKKKKKIAFLVFIISLAISLTGRMMFQGTSLGFGMGFGGALLAYASIVMLLRASHKTK